jgi:hypothetical protein
MTRAWWQLVWESPMAAQYIESDVPGLLTLAILKDEFARDPKKTSLAAEIRLQEVRFGLSPIDRIRFQTSASVRTSQASRRSAGTNSPARADPRDFLVGGSRWH